MGTRKNNKSRKKIRKTRSKRQRGGGTISSRNRDAVPNIKRTDLDIRKAVESVCSANVLMRTQAEAKYGNISDWDVSLVTNMKELFSGKESFNSDISRWDVSNVTNMELMFYRALAFNQPIGGWDVSNVTNMAGMFGIARIFNQPIDGWNVSNVTNMESMFYGALAFNQPIGDWVVSNVIYMEGMFYGARAFNQPIGCWDVEKVTNMESMFYGALAYDLTMLQPKKYEDRTDTEINEFIKQCPEIKPLQQLITKQYPNLKGIFNANGSIYKADPEPEPIKGGKRKSKKSKRKFKKSKRK